MKKISLLITFVVVLLLGLGDLNAQNNKSTYTDSWEWGGILPCTDDYAYGVETVVATYWGSKVQIRYKGSYEGLSGKKYTWSLLINENWKDFKEGQAFTHTYTSTSVVECEGVPIAIYKIRYHVTVTAKGEISVEKYSDSGDSWICL